MLGIIVIVLVILMILAAPTWSHSASWGYWPSGLVAVILCIVLLMWLLGNPARFGI